MCPLLRTLGVSLNAGDGSRMTSNPLASPALGERITAAS
jgi:hypothetical protein